MALPCVAGSMALLALPTGSGRRGWPKHLLKYTFALLLKERQRISPSSTSASRTDWSPNSRVSCARNSWHIYYGEATECSSRLAGAAVIVIYLTVMMPPALAQSTDGSRPGDLFSVERVGQAAGQVLKNNGIYFDAGYLNDILADVKGGNETRVTSTGDAFVAAISI